MKQGKRLFAQLMEFVPWTSVSRIVDRYGGNHNVRSLSCAEPRKVPFPPILRQIQGEKAKLNAARHECNRVQTSRQPTKEKQ